MKNAIWTWGLSLIALIAATPARILLWHPMIFAARWCAHAWACSQSWQVIEIGGGLPLSLQVTTAMRPTQRAAARGSC